MVTATVARSRGMDQVSVRSRIGIGLTLSALTLAMLILAFPPFDVWPLAFFCLVPMLVAQYRVLPLRWARLAPIVGVDLWVLWLVTMLFGLHVEPLFIQLIPVIVAASDWFSVQGTRQFHERTQYRDTQIGSLHPRL